MLLMGRDDSAAATSSGRNATQAYRLSTIHDLQPPVPARIFSVFLQMASIMLLTYCLCVRWPTTIRDAKAMSFSAWINIILYVDSLMFTAAQMIARYAFGLSSSFRACQSAIFICLSFYIITKLCLYIYFAERSFVVWENRGTRRTQNCFYIFNLAVVVGGYIVIIVLTFIFRIEHLSLDGRCMIGVQRVSGIPLATYETGINLYLAFLFLWPLRKMYSYGTRANPKLRDMAKRCLVGTSITTLATGANLTTVVVLNGEDGWLCIMLCNLDIVISVMTLHWVTSFGINKGLAQPFLSTYNNWRHTSSRQQDSTVLPMHRSPKDGTFVMTSIGQGRNSASKQEESTLKDETLRDIAISWERSTKYEDSSSPDAVDSAIKIKRPVLSTAP